MAQNRQLFKPWLRTQIDSGRYPGVEWRNAEHTLFSIPWKHASRHDKNSDDVLIFKEWAMTSAGPGVSIPGDPSVWKRNFRSALRARGFTMEQDYKNDPANPHKVYKWPEDVHSGETQEMSPGCPSASILSEESLYLGDDELFLDASQTPHILEHCLRGLNIDGFQTENQDSSLFVGETVENSFHVNGMSTVQPIPETLNAFQFSPAEGAVGGLGHSLSAQVPLGQNLFTQLEGAGCVAQHYPETPIQTASNVPEKLSFGTQFNVIVYYKGVKVLEKLVQNEAGFQLVSRTDANLMTGGLTIVRLPNTDSILDQTQSSLTQTILNNLDRLVVSCSDNKLFGCRWGDSRVFYTLNKHDQGSAPKCVPKNELGCIYSPKEFVEGLINFMHNEGECPSYSMFFFLGEQWPDPKNRPWEKKLIMVEVVLTALEQLKKMAVSGGASSQSSVELQISLEQMMDIY